MLHSPEELTFPSLRREAPTGHNSILTFVSSTSRLPVSHYVLAPAHLSAVVLDADLCGWEVSNVIRTSEEEQQEVTILLRYTHCQVQPNIFLMLWFSIVCSSGTEPSFTDLGLESNKGQSLHYP